MSSCTSMPRRFPAYWEFRGHTTRLLVSRSGGDRLGSGACVSAQPDDPALVGRGVHGQEDLQAVAAFGEGGVGGALAQAGVEEGGAGIRQALELGGLLDGLRAVLGLDDEFLAFEQDGTETVEEAPKLKGLTDSCAASSTPAWAKAGRPTPPSPKAATAWRSSWP